MAERAEMTPDQRFQVCATFTLHQEDQTDTGVFENDPRDAGGATRWGVTQAALSDWFGRPATVDEVRTLPRDTALLIARHKYWTPSRCDDLPAGVDYAVFDFAVNAGVARAAKFLQRAVGAVDDGVIGSGTLGLVAKTAPAKLLDNFANQKQRFYNGLATTNPSQQKFLKGWLARVDHVQDAAESMLA